MVRPWTNHVVTFRPGHVGVGGGRGDGNDPCIREAAVVLLREFVCTSVVGGEEGCVGMKARAKFVDRSNDRRTPRLVIFDLFLVCLSII